jgi:hypothetical protein
MHCTHRSNVLGAMQSFPGTEESGPGSCKAAMRAVSGGGSEFLDLGDGGGLRHCRAPLALENHPASCRDVVQQLLPVSCNKMDETSR